MSGAVQFRAHDYPGPTRVPLVGRAGCTESLQTSRHPVGPRLQLETIFPRRQRVSDIRNPAGVFEGCTYMYRPGDAMNR